MCFIYLSSNYKTNKILSGILKALISGAMAFGIINTMLSDNLEEMQFSFMLFIISGVSLIIMFVFEAEDFPEVEDEDNSENQEKTESHE